MAAAPEIQSEGLTKLPFPPVTKQHILNCSFHSWHQRYRAITPKARLIPLSQPFLNYLRADGIVLPPDDNDRTEWSDSDSGIFSSTDNASETEDDRDDDPSTEWPDIHQAVRTTIEELGGKVVPKLNWSAPKDATWIAATNSMECRTPNDIYLLLKSSDFVTHDLEHAFDDCEEDSNAEDSKDTGQHKLSTGDIPYHLVLRKHVTLNPSVEFRCFVRRRKLIALCQRDLNHFDFLFKMQDKLRDKIQTFFDLRLRDTFSDENFTFDVYVPPPHDRVWLVDINPWAQRTDPLLFSWLELLTLPGPYTETASDERTISIPFTQRHETEPTSPSLTSHTPAPVEPDHASSLDSSDDMEDVFIPEFRLVRRDDPEAYGFSTPQYSAHKLPRDVVDASRAGEGSLREFATQWKEVLAKTRQEDAEDSAEE
ncbi:D123-domain-containing protein [Lepidopterella palustris CBS 459.81]|uniref:D123-domain-containing protein n=1 Tax=Lepidopterella palustris CBS 459.81 TaxID=1314670 RepID=A0A8E2JC36_9PEZI|nr:D123-domain-containing protein [Lepidopterella palustris CBS 459.81]